MGTRQHYDWAALAARMIASIGRDDLVLSALAALCDLVEFDHTGVFLFQPNRRPRDLLSRHLADTYHKTYCGGTYLLDPFYKGSQRPTPGGVYRMPELDTTFHLYLDRYEMGPRLADILPPADRATPRCSNRLGEEIGFLLPIGAGRVVHIALIRSTACQPFCESEIDRLKPVSPVLQAVFERHFRWPMAADRDQQDAPTADTVVDATGIAGILTSREFEVVKLLRRGFMTEQIAARLAIAEGTVKVHRRNIYRKLAISSRSELLSTAAD